GGLQTLGALLDRELDLLALFEVAVALALDGGEVDEDVLPTFAGDEAVALGPIERLNRADDALRHCVASQKTKKGCYVRRCVLTWERSKQNDLGWILLPWSSLSYVQRELTSILREGMLTE